MTSEFEGVLSFWFDEIGQAAWYEQDAELDARVRDRFEGLWNRARRGTLDGWTCQPRSCLALVIVLDQFPRNMFRGDPRSFVTDPKALAVSKSAVDRGFDLRVDPVARQFFYLPLMHSEIAADQERAVRLFMLNIEGGSNLTHARAHRAVIRRFGRFPFRNAALGRLTTRSEAEWLAHGGYAAALSEVSPGALAAGE